MSDDAIELLLTDPKSYRALLESLWSQAHGAQKIPAVAEANTDPDEAAVSWLESNLKSDIVVPTTELTALGRRRAEAIERGILDGSDIDPARIFLVTDKPANCEDSAFVGLTLGLK